VAKYLQRAATVFDYIVAHGWSTAICGGGVMWCPRSNPSDQYKNAITNELFLTSAMSLHPYTEILKRPKNFYFAWATKEWGWFFSSGMINNQSLVNDGLTGACKNNGATTWTYNQGVLLSGLGMLAKATGSSSYSKTAEDVTQAVVNRLTVGGILHEPCSQCDGDQNLFKGIFMRHLGYWGSMDSRVGTLFGQFVKNNADSILKVDLCTNQYYGLLWEGPTVACNTATTSSVIDALLTASMFSGDQDSSWRVAACDIEEEMDTCCLSNVTEEFDCQAACAADPNAIAYEVHKECLEGTCCRVRTAKNVGCQPGWEKCGKSDIVAPICLFKN